MCHCKKKKSSPSPSISISTVFTLHCSGVGASCELPDDSQLYGNHKAWLESFGAQKAQGKASFVSHS